MPCLDERTNLIAPTIPELLLVGFRNIAYIRETVDQNNGRFCGGFCRTLIDIMISKAIHCTVGMIERLWIQWIHEDSIFRSEIPSYLQCNSPKLELVQNWTNDYSSFLNYRSRATDEIRPPLSYTRIDIYYIRISVPPFAAVEELSLPLFSFIQLPI
jgi:hypothetical protein